MQSNTATGSSLWLTRMQAKYSHVGALIRRIGDPHSSVFLKHFPPINNRESKMANDPDKIAPLLKTPAIRRPSTGRTQEELTFFRRSYLFLNLCFLSAFASILVFAIGLTLPSPTSDSVISTSVAMGILTMLISVVCSFLIASRMYGTFTGVVYSLITSTVVGWLIMFMLRKDLEGILRRNGFHVATLTATRNMHQD